MTNKNKYNITLDFEKTEGADKELTLVPLDSELWGVFGGAYENVINDVKLLIEEEKEIALENLLDTILHYMAFYPAVYLVMPYLVQLLEKKSAENDFESQIVLITNMGMMLTIDIQDESYLDEENLSNDVMNNYNLSIIKLQEITKRFLEQHLDEVAKNSYHKVAFLTSVLVILGNDKKEAFAMSMSMWGSCYMLCDKCEALNEDIEFGINNKVELEVIFKEIIPAPSALGQWDGKSLDNTYIWFSNLLAMAGADREAKLMLYYYGTYECRECGNKKQVIEFVKNYYCEED